MCKIKRNVDKSILWKVGKSEVSFWFDKWCNLGPLCDYLPEGFNSGKLKLNEVLIDEEWNWYDWDTIIPQHVMVDIEGMGININPSIPDKPIWMLDNSGKFSMASAWQLLRQKQPKTWINSSTWQKELPFKMCFFVWRSLRDRVPTDQRVRRMGFAVPSRCCKESNIETIGHLMYFGTYAQSLWKIVCGPLGITFKDILYRLLLIKWWSWKNHNPVYDLICKCLPIITSWEILRKQL
ncbi:hypothetical protein K7X08_026620 [Anisodus acutangulus]|uniref:Reverse transcriptase zinc-binding domain-containing protein n=1 Tax=Anisodus acutangulus TaxID=402998 RepID=A0A9Q1LB86_9SOLA|nr:hypothetical protein K7X08_026620 [Anisodus acutangulus]